MNVDKASTQDLCAAPSSELKESTMSVRVTCLGVVLASAVVLCVDARAGTNPSVTWSSPGSGCVVDTALASHAAVSAQTGDVSFASGQTGLIRLTCPVHGLFPTDTGAPQGPEQMNVTFYDTDGTADGCFVQVFLLRNNASASEGGQLIASYDDTLDTAPDAPSNSVPFRNHKSRSFSHAWNFDGGYYWFEILLGRSVTTCNVALEGVQLVDQILVH